jgi:ribosome-associated protein YbcJ (S4-like RNA binding protein)
MINLTSLNKSFFLMRKNLKTRNEIFYLLKILKPTQSTINFIDFLKFRNFLYIQGIMILTKIFLIENTVLANGYIETTYILKLAQNVLV